VKKPENHRAATGHDGPAQRANGRRANGNGEAKPPNGHATISLERGGISARGEHAASDDECGTFASGSANSSATRANREPSADAAPASRSGKKEPIEFPGPTDFTAMQDGQAFARTVGEEVDLVAVSASLLQSGDEKIRKAELDKIREMIFGKVGTSGATAEGPVLMWDTTAADPGPAER
jgi:hypothetical protein